MAAREISSVRGRDGANVSFKLLLNNGDVEGAPGAMFGGGAGGILHNSGNQGFLGLGDIGTDFVWSSFHIDVVSTGTKPVISIKMNDADNVSGLIHVDQIGVIKNTGTASDVPANLIGDATLDGTFDIDGRIQAFPN